MLSQDQVLSEAFAQISGLSKRQYSQQEIDEARGNLALMNDQVFMMVFADNKNNHILTEIVNALRKIHGLALIPPILRTMIQEVTLLDVLGRGMVADLMGEGRQINIAVEIQKGSQADYAVRGTISSGNVMRRQFNAGDEFTEAPDVIGVNILGFKLTELEKNRMFCARIVRSDYDTKATFLADKYSDYYVELPKMDNWTKIDLPEQYHELWEFCSILRAKIKDQEEVIRMQAITNPAALELANETKKAVAPSEFVNETISRENELEQLRVYLNKQIKKAEEKTAKETAEKTAKETAEKTAEKMLIIALKSNASPMVIENMREAAGITEARLSELKNQIQIA